MTSPEKPADKPADTKPAPAPVKLRRGQVVSFRTRDPILGSLLEGAGVVLSARDGEPVIVRPLAAADLHVDPSNVVPVSTDDVD